MDFKVLISKNEFYWILFLISIWLIPGTILKLDPSLLHFLEVFWMLEFLMGHSGVAFALVLACKGSKLFYPAFFVFSLFYGIFFIAFSIHVALIPIFFYNFTLLNRAFDIEKRIKNFLQMGEVNVKTKKISDELLSSFGRTMLLIFCLGVGVFGSTLWPKFGLVGYELPNASNGIEVGYQGFCMAYILYFGLLMFFDQKFKNVVLEKKDRED